MERRNLIEVEVLFETKDYWRNYLGYFLSFQSVLVYFFTFCIFGLSVSFLFLGKQIELSHLLDVFLTSFLFVLLFGFVMSYFSVSNAKNLSDGKCKYSFSDEKVTISAKSFNTQIDWTYFINAKETKNNFILAMKDGQNNFLPKRFFQDYEQIADFKNLLRSKLGERASLKKSKENLGLK